VLVLLVGICGRAGPFGEAVAAGTIATLCRLKDKEREGTDVFNSAKAVLIMGTSSAMLSTAGSVLMALAAERDP